jgi:hypothetical protein
MNFSNEIIKIQVQVGNNSGNIVATAIELTTYDVADNKKQAFKACNK